MTVVVVPTKSQVDNVGHSSAYMTDQYRHLLDGARTDAAAALDALLEA